MDDNALEDLLRRLTTLVVKLDQTYDQLLLMVEQHQEFNREQREFNRERLRINARLETLMTEVFRQWATGRYLFKNPWLSVHPLLGCHAQGQQA